MRRNPLPLIALSLVLALAAAGCATVDESGPAAGTQRAAEEAKRYRFADLPVPGGLSLDLEKSFVFESPGTRAGYLVYSGLQNYENIVRFYRERMSEHGWKLVASFERSETSMTFEKPGWVAGIVIRPQTLTTRVEIHIGPRATPIVERDVPRR